MLRQVFRIWDFSTEQNLPSFLLFWQRPHLYLDQYKWINEAEQLAQSPECSKETADLPSNPGPHCCPLSGSKKIWRYRNGDKEKWWLQEGIEIKPELRIYLKEYMVNRISEMSLIGNWRKKKYKQMLFIC